MPCARDLLHRLAQHDSRPPCPARHHGRGPPGRPASAAPASRWAPWMRPGCPSVVRLGIGGRCGRPRARSAGPCQGHQPWRRRIGEAPRPPATRSPTGRHPPSLDVRHLSPFGRRLHQLMAQQVLRLSPGDAHVSTSDPLGDLRPRRGGAGPERIHRRPARGEGGLVVRGRCGKRFRPAATARRPCPSGCWLCRATLRPCELESWAWLVPPGRDGGLTGLVAVSVNVRVTLSCCCKRLQQTRFTFHPERRARQGLWPDRNVPAGDLRLLAETHVHVRSLSDAHIASWVSL